MTELARIETQQPMKIADLTIDSEINVSRLGQLDLVVVAEYAEAMQDNIIFPDVVAFDDGENKWLSDGFHRVEAAKTSRLDEIGVDLRSGSRDDAIEYACQANAGHGLQRTNEGKRVVVELMLKRRNEWSDRQIAQWCKVDHKFVGKIRKDLTGDIPSMKQRTFVHHKTGKPATMNTANIGKPKAEVELVLDADDAKGLEKAVWDYTQKNSMALRWRAFVDSLLKMLKIEDSIIRDFSHDEFVTRLGSMSEAQLSESHERLIQTADWLANLIRALEDTDYE